MTTGLDEFYRFDDLAFVEFGTLDYWSRSAAAVFWAGRVLERLRSVGVGYPPAVDDVWRSIVAQLELAVDDELRMLDVDFQRCAAMSSDAMRDWDWSGVGWRRSWAVAGDQGVREALAFVESDRFADWFECLKRPIDFDVFIWEESRDDSSRGEWRRGYAAAFADCAALRGLVASGGRRAVLREWFGRLP